jgi:hypothetical protein
MKHSPNAIHSLVWRLTRGTLLLASFLLCSPQSDLPADEPAKGVLRAGFGECDITPGLDAKPVYMAGFGKNRKATGVHDPLMARAVVFTHGGRKLAMVSVDLVGLFQATVERVRSKLPGFTYILVSSTHNHEGPDTLGLWGPNLVTSGIDPAYLKKVEEGIVKAVRDAEAAVRPVYARIGTALAPELLHDGREPYIKHDELVALALHDADSKKTAGLVVQWNCHPETLGSRNTQLSADFIAATVAYLKKKHGCPVVYFTGTVGGLMTSLHVEIKDAQGTKLADGTFAKTERYGELVGRLAERALSGARDISLVPLEVRARHVFLPLDNTFYVFGWRLGALDRQAYLWTGDVRHAKPADAKVPARTPLCLRSELAWLRLGELEIAAIPGEIYPELVLGKVQDPADPGADFPQAPIEPAIYKQLKSRHKMLIGLANDELGYIIPKRQWDEKAPFCYGRKSAQYGEVNSLGPETAPILCKAFQELVEKR